MSSWEEETRKHQSRKALKGQYGWSVGVIGPRVGRNTSTESEKTLRSPGVAVARSNMQFTNITLAEELSTSL